MNSMSVKFLLAALIVVSLAPYGLAQATAGGGKSADMAARIMPEVSRLRGLDYTRDVPVRVVTRDEVARYVAKVIDEDMAPEELEGTVRLLAYLGLVERDIDLRKVISEAYATQVAGFYDDDEESLSLVEDSAMAGAMDSVTIAHELVHALQDQHYDLGSLHDFTKDNDDASLALMALVEGDASEIMMRFGTEATPRGVGGVRDYTSVVSMSMGPEGVPGLPLIFQQDMMFPYSYGTRFVAEIQRQAGPDAPDLAFAAPPVSTEQVINPAKYLAREEPWWIVLPDFSESLGDGWRRVDESPLGQFNLGIYLSVSLGSWGVEEAIEGWNGDTLAAYVRGDDEVFIVYYSAWDSERDAREFLSIYRRLIETRFSGVVAVVSREDHCTWEKDGLAFYIRRRGADVVVVESVPVGLAAKVILGSREAQKTPWGIANPIADRSRIQPRSEIAR